MTYKDWIEVFTIMAKHAKPSSGNPEKTGLDIYAPTGADHDVFYFPLTYEDIPEDSEDGMRLLELGLFLFEDETWATFT